MIAVLANDAQWDELITGADAAALVRTSSLPDDNASYDACILLDTEAGIQLNSLQVPLLLHAVVDTLKELNAAANVYRINGWNGFLRRSTWEVAGTMDTALNEVFACLNRQFIRVADEPGLVAARTVAMIVNEGYFALGEQVSSKAEIDIAMKLGTNYPFGPFEWDNKIGTEHIYKLLNKLSKTDQRYLPAPLLKQEATK